MIDELCGLVETFERDIEIASQIESPNERDDLTIKAAIAGFAYKSTTDEWCISDFEFVKARIDSELPQEELEEYGQNSENIKLFYSLCIGYLLGSFRSGQLDDLGFKRAEPLIPGIIMMNLERLTRSSFNF